MIIPVVLSKELQTVLLKDLSKPNQLQFTGLTQRENGGILMSDMPHDRGKITKVEEWY